MYSIVCHHQNREKEARHLEGLHPTAGVRVYLFYLRDLRQRLGRSGQRAAVTQTLQAINTHVPSGGGRNGAYDHTLATETTLLALEGKGHGRKERSPSSQWQARMTYLLIIVSRFAFFFCQYFCYRPSQSSSPFVSRFSCSKFAARLLLLSVVGRRTGVNIVKKSSYVARSETNRRHG